MRITQRGAALAAAAAALTGMIAGCGKNATVSGPGASLDPASAVVTVNGVPITQGEFYTDLQAFRFGQNQQPEPAGRALLRQMIQDALVEQLAKKQNVYPTAAQISDQLNNYALLQEAESVEPFDEQLKDIGLTTGDIERSQIVPQLCQLNLLSQGVTPTDADIQGFYNANMNTEFTEPNRAHIKRMVLATEGDARDVFQKIQAGSTFEAQYPRSIDKQFVDGDIPAWVPMDHPDAKMAPLVNALAKTDVGKVTPPVQIRGTWWISEVIAKQPRELLPLEKVKSLIGIALRQQHIQSNPTAMMDFQNDLRNAQISANIVVADARYQPVISQIENPPPMGPNSAMAPSASPPPTAPAPQTAPPAPPAPQTAPAPKTAQ